MHLFSALNVILFSSQTFACLVRYDWNITTLNTTLFDGVRGNLGYGINNEPADRHPINITFGDEVEVHVTNKLTEDTCIHWHGLRQFGTQEMDGISGITQCQIPPNVTAIYRFKPDKCGTFWFHGHEEVQYAFGLRGPLIVHCPPRQQQSWEKDVYKEYTILLADWYHDLPVGAPIWDTVLINNVGRYNCTIAQAAGFDCGPNAPLPRFHFKPGKKYLLRLINTSAMAAFKFSIDNHTFQVVASDADYVKPSTPINTITINVAQRYDILVQAASISQCQTLTSESYWIRVHSLFGLPWTARSADQVPNGFNPNAFAIIDYEVNMTSDPTTSTWPIEVTIPEFDYLPVTPISLPTIPDQRIVVEFTLAVLPPNPTAFLGYISLNEQSFSSLEIPRTPPLFTITQGADTNDLPTTANAIALQYNAHVEVVVVNETPDQHPFHLHAHSPWIIGSGRASRENILGNNFTALRLENPMQHDVFTVPECETDAEGACQDLGYVVFRMNADNPGVWMMHCHIEWHFVIGLGMLFVEAQDALHEEGLGAFSSNMLLSVCNGNYISIKSTRRLKEQPTYLVIMPRHVNFQTDESDEYESARLHPLLQYDMAIILWLVQQKEKRPWLRTLIHSTTSRRRTQDCSLLIWFVFITMIPEFGFPYFWICIGNLLVVATLQFVANCPRPLDLHPILWQMQHQRNFNDTRGFPCLDSHMAIVVMFPAILHSQSMIVQFIFVLIILYIALCKLLLATRFLSQVLASFILGFTGILIGNHGTIIIKSYKLPRGYMIAAIIALLVFLMLVLGTWIENNESTLIGVPKQDFLDVFTNILHSDVTTSEIPLQHQESQTLSLENKSNDEEEISSKRDSFYFLIQGMRARNSIRI
ncbi:hypothetical protein F443_08110 [Plasmopara halstedii]|uniref:Multicopper oxidase n=1 Tax=Plasmopara halstedii TaxID=4781 RepID=A0A0P1AJV2_PLAHL|nr:hypothetical protein F443_08110 [Plasmopara halstedii]CEG41127.1 hypothetical protein F443_08110 [Plasmopara halstedii]|eukprot:XP_024577496.1 hypothetical protein F443_08110 [Plasmopara halstedii]